MRAISFYLACFLTALYLVACFAGYEEVRLIAGGCAVGANLAASFFLSYKDL